MPGKHVRRAAPAARGPSTAPAMARRISAVTSGCLFIMAALIGVIIEHSVAPHLGVGYRVPVARQRGTHPPAAAAIPRGAPRAHRASHARAAKSPGPSVTSVPGAVRLTMIADRGPAAAKAFGGLPGAQPFVDLLSSDGSWAFGTAAIGVPAGVAAMPETALFLARASGGSWHVALDGSSAFAQMLLQAPSGLMPPAESQLLAEYNAAQEAAAANPGNAGGQSGPGRSAGSKSSSPAASGSPSGSAAPSPSADPAPERKTGLALPWTAGQSWTMTGVRGQAPPGADPLAMASFAGGDGRVLSAGSGRIYRFCAAGSGAGHDALIEVIHPGGSATEYYQMDGETTVPDGSMVDQGSYLGMTGNSGACGGGSTGSPQVEFTLLSASGNGLDGAQIGGWTFRETLQPLRIWAQDGGQKVLPAKPLQNLAPAVSPGNL